MSIPDKFLETKGLIYIGRDSPRRGNFTHDMSQNPEVEMDSDDDPHSDELPVERQLE
jgi:hypothetical protein